MNIIKIIRNVINIDYKKAFPYTCKKTKDLYKLHVIRTTNKNHINTNESIENKHKRWNFAHEYATKAKF